MLSIAVLLLTTQLGGPADSPGKTALLPECLVTLIERADVPAREAGQLVEVVAREGQSYEQGTLLARIDDQPVHHQKRVAEKERDVAQAKATNDIEVRHAAAAADVAKVEIDNASEANRRSPGTITKSQINKLSLEHKTATLQIEKARFEQQVNRLSTDAKQAEVEATETQIERRRIVSPISGQVVEVFKRVGEWVQPGERVFRVVRLDRLRVEGFLKSDQFDPVDIDGQPVTVTIQRAGGREATFTGRITFTSPVVEANGMFRVWAEVENRQERNHWMLRPGLIAAMTIAMVGE